MKNKLLRTARQHKGWSQQQLADFAELSPSTIERAERGEPIRVDSIQRLCTCLQKTPEQLGLLETAHEVDKRLDIVQALQTLETTGTHVISTLSPQIDLQSIEKLFTHKLIRLLNWIIEELEDGTRLRWQLYYNSKNSLTEDGLLEQIIKLEQLANDGGQNYTRICQLLVQNYQLAGSLARDNFRYNEAAKYFRKAYYIANEINQPDLKATALARQGLIFLRQNYFEKALELYQDATDVAKSAESQTRAYIISGLAEALARNGYSKECYEKLDEAEKLLTQRQRLSPEEDLAYVQLTMQSLQDARGECFVLLGEPVKGLDYLISAEHHSNQHMSRNHCRLLMQQAEAFLAANQPDQCVQHTLKGLFIARQIESISNINWSQEIYTKLHESKWTNEPLVAHLQEAIRTS